MTKNICCSPRNHWTKSKTHQPIQKFDITFFSGGNLQLKCPNYKRKGAQQSSKNILNECDN